MRKFHRVASMVSLLGLLLLALTGLYLNHSDSFQRLDIRDPFARGISVMAQDPNEANRVWIGTKHGLFLSQDGGVNAQEVRLPFPAKKVRYLQVASDGSVYAGLADGVLFRLDVNGPFWERLILPSNTYELKGMIVFGESIMIVNRQGLFQRRMGQSEWALLQKDVYPRPVRDWVKDIHTGHIFRGPLLVWLYDISAVILLGLIVTGIAMFFRKR
ncbi:hypothetical protein HOH87_03855 [bacterium]|mgnify:CR=1 FL=1|jgi:hypothetical protein|nr:hypothetical protein [bacterium]